MALVAWLMFRPHGSDPAAALDPDYIRLEEARMAAVLDDPQADSLALPNLPTTPVDPVAADAAAAAALDAGLVLAARSGRPPLKALLFLHGLGDSGRAWTARAARWQESLPDLAVVLPSAPAMAVTAASGMSLPAWYDVLSMRVDGPQAADSIRAGAEMVRAMVAKVAEDLGLPQSAILVAGFSMGAALALFAALETRLLGAPHRGGHLVAVGVLSGYLPLHTLVASAKARRRGQPEWQRALPPLAVFMAHGARDAVVPLQAAAASARALEREPWIELEFFTVRGCGHETCTAEELEFVRWLGAR
ncbi:carboxylesterase [Thecamonas trahens ATCC 50062]|uniref:Carboxylesterase n=1 Tax=Thecamonas trahens ATCC 50062 TaxID=461836 RepID=A0A0L0DH42_THETB|nr:carboxylesterase [Thecamonas trahens ATCC 50062]KNC50623.1 carboxylesterase [Thecamonas trahens ATCC 50062]|eukprot:XP_013762510.1 carboxylesterase [Thecamonas trahens ATCC 50062]